MNGRAVAIQQEVRREVGLHCLPRIRSPFFRRATESALSPSAHPGRTERRCAFICLSGGRINITVNYGNADRTPSTRQAAGAMPARRLMCGAQAEGVGIVRKSIPSNVLPNGRAARGRRAVRGSGQ
ncbi:protein of unknown function [Paraburkholderia kururiensis]